MCKHDWYVIYQEGGTFAMCRICGLSTPWKRNGEDGSGRLCLLLSMAMAVFPAFLAWLILRPHYGQGLADIGALIAWLIASGVCCWMLCACSLASPLDDHEGEIE